MSAGPTRFALGIAVFARTPVPGAAKTRLIPRLGAAGAARLQAQLTQRALARAAAVASGHTSLWLAGERADLRDPPDVPIHAQHGGDLGARMAHAFEALLPRYEAVLLIGTDCPAQTQDDLRHAARGLIEHDVVLQPAEDGGYVLIGFSQRVLPAAPPRWREVFDSVAWGSDAVMAQTLERIAAAGLAVAMLETRPDLDLPEDYDRAIEAGWIADVATVDRSSAA